MDKSNDIKLNTIGKAVSILETIKIAKRPLSIKDIAKSVGLNKSSIHHHIKTLTTHGYLQQDKETRKYDIGLSLVSVGQAYLQRLDVRGRGHLFLEELSSKLNETVHMLVLDHNKAVYVDKIDVYQKPGALQCSSYVGLRTDVYSTASGKVLLSYLEPDALNMILEDIEFNPITTYTITNKADFEKEIIATKERGYGLDLQENALGQGCIAVPIWNLNSECVAAVSVSCTIENASQEALERDVLATLKETGDKISEAMGYVPE